ncbi:MAG TPA: hypothetical protein VK966_03435, partial [Longimicrobiales bacterium]|nr:hypothetical protein [Longimicrobiales bacterium]
MIRALGPVAVACLAACAPATQSLDEPGPVAETEPVSGDSVSGLPPAGYGSLRQDEFSVELVATPLHVKVTPLAEEVIRLAAPDTYGRLHALAISRRPQAESEVD